MNILVIANCRLGDSLVMLPALKVLRGQYPDAHIALASEALGHGFIAAKDILGGRGIIDDFIPMHAPQSRLARLSARIRFICNLRRRCWDLGIVLMPPYPPLTMALVARFSLYLRLAGARRVIAPTHILQPQKSPDGAMLPMPSVVDATLAILAPLGISLPPPGKADAALPPLKHAETTSALPEKMLIAVAPGANMPAKCWPIDNFASVLSQFCRQHDAMPIYLCGENERAIGETLNSRVPGIALIGHGMQEVETVLRQCAIFLGNDTGLGHLAAAVGLPCVSIFSGRDIPGIWEPYTSKKTVLRAGGIPCEGCLKTVCDKSPQPCLVAITPEDVLVQLNALLP